MEFVFYQSVKQQNLGINEFVFCFFLCSQSGFEPLEVSAPLPWFLPLELQRRLLLLKSVFKDGWFALICLSFTSGPCAA